MFYEKDIYIKKTDWLIEQLQLKMTIRLKNFTFLIATWQKKKIVGFEIELDLKKHLSGNIWTAGINSTCCYR